MFEELTEYNFWCDHENFGKIKGRYICSSAAILNDSDWMGTERIFQNSSIRIDNSDNSSYNEDGKG